MSTPSAPVMTPTARAAAVLGRWSVPILVANLIAQILIIVTGGAVRLTASGLGCSSWPQCEPGHFTPQHVDATSFHALIEFGNRTITGVLLIISALVAVTVWTDRSRNRSYRLLGLVPIAGVLLQAVIGGITVLVRLNPAIVSSHLLISMALVAASTILLRRVKETDGPARALVSHGLTAMARALVVATAVVLALGVVVTGSGPHSGDAEVGYRFAVDPATMAKVHALAVWVFLALLGVLLVGLFRQPAPRAARRSGLALLGVTILQGVIGYVQYATGLPIVLVGIHMLAAALLTATTAWFVTSLRQRA